MTTTDPKQVIIIRKDLKMRRGKEIAQGAHASEAAFLDIGHVTSVDRGPDYFAIPLDRFALEEWLVNKSFKKVVCSVDSEEELIALYEKAKTENLLCSLILDSGLTEFGGVKTYTAVAIGPDFPEKIDPITSHLKLY